MTRYFNVNKVYFNGFANNSVKEIVNSVNCNNVYYAGNTATGFYSNCYNLKTVTNSKNNYDFMTGAFYNCYNLTEVPSIPNNVKNMEWAFHSCENLQNVTFEENSTVVEMQNAFHNCYNLQDITIPNTVVNMRGAFRNCLSFTYAPTIPDSVVDMADAFHYDTNITSANNISNSAETLHLTFSGTGLIESPTIPNSVTNMVSTFYKCFYLNSIPHIPVNVDTLHYTFGQCSNITGNIYIDSEKVKYAQNCFMSTIADKDVYIPFQYTNESKCDPKDTNLKNYIKNGTLNEDRSFINNTTTANNIDVPEIFTPSDYDSWEIHLQFITSNNVTTQQRLLGNRSGGQLANIALGITNGKFQWYFSLDGSTWAATDTGSGSSFVVQPNTIYHYKITCDYNYATSLYTYTFSVRTDSSTVYTTIGTYSSSSKIHGATKVLTFGATNASGFLGSLDLDNCYIKLNNDIWWKPFCNINKHCICGSIIGNLYNYDGIFTNFNDTNYIQLNKSFSVAVQNANSWEIYTRVYRTQDGIRQKIFAGGTATANSWLGIESSNKIRVRLRRTPLSEFLWDFTGTTTINSNKWYYLKLAFTGTEYNVAYSEDGINWTLEGSTETSEIIGNVSNDWTIGKALAQNYFNPWSGRIDLNNFYIKINGEYWCKGIIPESKNIIKETRVVGKVTDNNGIISDFTSSNYLQPNLILDEDISNWEITLKVKCSEEQLSDNKGQDILVIGKDLNTNEDSAQILLACNLACTTIYSKIHELDGITRINGASFSWAANLEKWYKMCSDSTGTHVYTSDDGINWSICTGSEGTAYSNDNTTLSAGDKIYLGDCPITGKYSWKGNIDLKECYMIANNQLIWDGYTESYHKDIIDGTIVGRVQNTNFIVSNFAETNYIETNKIIDTTNDWEAVFKAHVVTDSTIARRCLLGSSQTYCLSFGITYDNKMIAAFGNGSNQAQAITGTTALTTDKIYYFKLSKVGSTCSLYYSEDGTTWTLDASDTVLYTASFPLQIGVSTANTTAMPWKSWIDLNESYVKVNGQLLYNGKKDASKELNGTIVGTLNNLDGIISGFTDSSHFVLNDTLDVGTNSWEIQLKVKPTTLSEGQDIAGYVGTTGGLSFYLNSDSYMSLNIGDAGSWRVQPLFGQVTTLNTWYWLKAVYNNGVYTTYLSTDGINFELGQSITNAWTLQPGNLWLGDFATGGTPWFKGAIDLNECYIKINNQIWWEGIKRVNTQTYNSFNTAYPMQLNTTVVGTLTNNNYVYSGFSNSNYLQLPEQFSPGSNTWEMQFKVKLNSISYEVFIIDKPYDSWYGIRLSITTAGAVGFLASTTSDTSNVISLYSPNGSFSVGDEKYIKVTWDGQKYYMYFSLDKREWTLQNSFNSSLPVYNFSADTILGTLLAGGSNYLNGEIDLKECYIKINNEYWWKGAARSNGVNLIDSNDVPIINVEGYEYLLDGTESVTLTRYIGEGGAITIPNV